jgi:hypothetical protein
LFVVEDQAEKAQVEKAQKAPAANEAKNKSKEETKPPIQVKRIELQPTKGQSPEDAWAAYFRKALHQGGDEKAAQDAIDALSADVRETARLLMNEGKYQEVATMLQSSMQNGHFQPWMYEALGTAMYLSGAPKEDLERVLLSAVDFASNDDEVIHLVKLMAEFGLEEQSLELLKEVSDRNPMRPEPYMYGLEIANRLKDVDSIGWACAGILSQGWTKQQLHIPKKAMNIAKSMLADLSKQKRDAEASKLEKQFSDALQRDCIVQVTWTGEADIDVSIQEPSGDVCSLSNPRSTGGGVLVGDAFSKPGEKPVEGYSELYVCPKAFTGEYRLLIRRVWGDVAAGKVTVDVVTNYGTKQQKNIRQQVPLNDKDALVIFEVPKGRRVEHLAQQQLANLEEQRMDLGRGIVARELATIAQTSPSSTSAAYDYIRSRTVDPRVAAAIRGRRGSAGFMPIVISLPQGTQMSIATAVVSGDRRYVRLSIPPIPIFTGIGDVATFNFVTGAQGGQQGGGGGQVGGGAGGVF